MPHGSRVHGPVALQFGTGVADSKYTEAGMARPRISLAILVKDQEATLGHAIASAQAFVDEVVVRDTGSTDGSPALAWTMGARVIRGTWKDDFATARNQLVASCTGDWILMLDADEILVDGGTRLARLLRRPAAPAFAVEIESALGFGRSETTSLVRLFRRSSDPFRHRVFERIETLAAVATSPLRLVHSGFTGVKRRDKALRNLQLLGLALDESPGDAYLLWRRGHELELLGREREANVTLDAMASSMLRLDVPHLIRHGFAPEALAAWTSSLERRDLLARALPLASRVVLAASDRPLARFLHARALAAAGRADHAREAARTLLEPRSWRYQAPGESALLTHEAPRLLQTLRLADAVPIGV